MRHPFDVGDRVVVGDDGSYTVKEIRLLSTILLDGHGTYVQVANTVLAGLVRLIGVIQTAYSYGFPIVHSKYSPQPQGWVHRRLQCRLAKVSCQMSESFSFDVDYTTTFKQIETLRSMMLGFVQMERRDFQPAFDITVVGMCQNQGCEVISNTGLASKDIPDQDKMTLQADIMYKSNWQQGSLKGRSFDVEQPLERCHC